MHIYIFFFSAGNVDCSSFKNSRIHVCLTLKEDIHINKHADSYKKELLYNSHYFVRTIYFHFIIIIRVAHVDNI